MSGVILGAEGFPTDPAVLMQRLQDVDAAYHQLMIGGAAVTLSYAQGAGTKSVTFTRANIAQLAAYRAQLLRLMGIRCPSPRRPIRVRF